MRKGYVENNIYYGRDRRGNNIMVRAFEVYKIVNENDAYYFVKKNGKGNYRVFAINKNTETFFEI